MQTSFFLQGLHVHLWITMAAADQAIHAEEDSP